jgi:hypothetical protein
MLAVLRRQHGALAASMAGSAHRAAEWQRYAEELERRLEAQEARIADVAAAGAAGLREQFDGQIESYRLAVVTLARRVQASARRVSCGCFRRSGREARGHGSCEPTPADTR